MMTPVPTLPLPEAAGTLMATTLGLTLRTALTVALVRDSSACTGVPTPYTATHSTAARAARCGRSFIGRVPFGSLAAFGPRGSEVHSFPPPPHDGFSIVGELPSSPASSRNNPSTDFSRKRVCRKFSGKRVGQRTPALTRLVTRP